MIDIAANLRRFLALLACAYALPSTGHADTATVRVGTMRVPPFVLRGDDGQWGGLSIDLWKLIAAELKIPFEFRDYDYDPAGLPLAVERGEIDVAVAAIPVTHDGETRFDFSHPYFAANLGIVVHADPDPGVFGAVASFLTLRTFGALATLLGLLIVVGALIWLLERRQRTHFDPRPLPGIGEGIWWAAVTMTTTGYGDKVPISWRGRSLAIVWMFSSIFLISLFSATLASSFVVDRLRTGITSINDLARAPVAAVTGSAGEQWLGDQGISARNYPFVIQASKALQRGDVHALVYERAILGYMIKEYGWRDLEILPHTLAVRDYAIAIRPDSPLKEQINRALLKVIHRPDWKETVQRYVGSNNEPGLTEKR
jgi:polar amino acid transport system substrate-binding protein